MFITLLFIHSFIRLKCMILPNKLYLSYCYTRLSILNRSPSSYTMYNYKSIAEIAETILECFKHRFSSHHHPISYERVHPVTSYYTTHPWIHSITLTEHCCCH